MRISVWNYNRTRLCKVRRTGFWCSVLFNPKIWLFSKQIIVNNNFLLIQLNIIHSHPTEKVGCFFLCKKIISKNFCYREHFAFLTLGYQWRGITICCSRRNCGDNWILLPREDTGYGTCQDMCGCEVIKNLSCGLSAPEIKAPLLFHKTCLTFTSCRGGRREITLRKDRWASRQYPEIRGQASVGTYRKQADRRSRDAANFLLHDLCNSGRCGDNTGILLRCRISDFWSVPIRCGSFSFVVFLNGRRFGFEFCNYKNCSHMRSERRWASCRI